MGSCHCLPGQLQEVCRLPAMGIRCGRACIPPGALHPAGRCRNRALALFRHKVGWWVLDSTSDVPRCAGKCVHMRMHVYVC